MFGYALIWSAYGHERDEIDNNDDDDDDNKTTHITLFIYSFVLNEHNAIYLTISVQFYPGTERFKAPII